LKSSILLSFREKSHDFTIGKYCNSEYFVKILLEHLTNMGIYTICYINLRYLCNFLRRGLFRK
jgi:hypothetical protein